MEFTTISSLQAAALIGRMQAKLKAEKVLKESRQRGYVPTATASDAWDKAYCR